MVTTSTGRLMVDSTLGVEARHAFIETARAATVLAETTGTELELDCSCLDGLGPLDDPIIGMLVTIARVAQRRGTRVALVNASRRTRAQLEAAGVGHFFDWQP